MIVYCSDTKRFVTMKVKTKIKPTATLLSLGCLAATVAPSMAVPGDCIAVLRAACSPEDNGGFGPSDTPCQMCTGHLQHELREAGCTNTIIQQYCRDAARKVACQEVAFERPRGAIATSLAYTAADDLSLGLSARFPSALGSSVPALFCPSAAAERHGSVVMLSEWFGVTAATTNVASVMNSAGIDVYVVNSYRDHEVPVDSTNAFSTVEGVSGVQRDSGHKMKSLAWGDLAADIAAVVDQLNQNHSDPVALVGFSEGGALALLASQSAKRLHNVAATAVFYGSPGSIYTGTAASLFQAATVDVPVHLSCGSLDTIANFSSCETLETLKGQLMNAPTAIVTHYTGVGHGFLNSEKWWEQWKAAQVPPRDPYNPGVASQALREAISFLLAHMQRSS
eukprot:COSAG02_NODE_918_length_15945_cov_5.640752_11_plen_395_part_00